MTTTANTETKGNSEIINKVILTGHLGKDPTLDTVGTSMKVSKFSIATNNDYKNAKGERVKDTQWHNIVMWGKVANEAYEKLKKGAKITVEGKIQYRMFTDKEGVKKQYTDIVAFSFTVHQKREEAAAA
jgi:single-strand DNA-binding protein